MNLSQTSGSLVACLDTNLRMDPDFSYLGTVPLAYSLRVGDRDSL